MSQVDYLSALNSKGSGLNITQIVDALIDAEKTPQAKTRTGPKAGIVVCGASADPSGGDQN